MIGALLLCVCSCATAPTPQQRLRNSEQLTAEKHWRRLDIKAPPFILTSYLPAFDESTELPQAEVLSIYIEGDGLAWHSRTRVSADPTPIDPLALRLALGQPEGIAVYLARPGQYTLQEHIDDCDPKYWTSHRFAPEVVTATSRAITVLKEQTGAQTIRLVGYSGGGAIAALVAAERTDIHSLLTIAGNLDPVLWAIRQRISPLDGSLNPADAAAKLAALPQLHFTGTQDRVVPQEIVRSFLARQPQENCSAQILVDGAGHTAGWAEQWPTLLQTSLPCSATVPVTASPPVQ